MSTDAYTFSYSVFVSAHTLYLFTSTHFPFTLCPRVSSVLFALRFVFPRLLALAALSIPHRRGSLFVFVQLTQYHATALLLAFYSFPDLYSR